MPPSILITDCLQNDFIGPIDKFDGLPNALHIGHDESLRLLGDNPAEGPIARTIAWAHQQPDTELKVIHVRDWHNPSDSNQQHHLQQFGNHCIQHSVGAEFLFDVEAVNKDISIVNATTLSNFIDADLGKTLAPYETQTLRVGVMGVWTEAKITFLVYDLRSRYPNFQIAVCSALTASSSRDNHFLALDQLERILGVDVIPSVGEFIEFLGGESENAPLIGFSQKHPIVNIHGEVNLGASDAILLRYLFRGCKQVDVSVLDGGFSGNVVLGTKSIDLHGHEQASHVVKIGPKDLIGRERTCFERIESVLGNSAPRVTDFADYDQRGAIKYRYAAMGGGQSQSLQKIYAQGADEKHLAQILDAIFIEQLGRFYRVAQSEFCDLFTYYEFKPDWAPSVARKVQAVLQRSDDADELTFNNGNTLPNVARFYDQVLPTLPRMPRSHYFSYVHGDLNGANIIIDAQHNVWLIDFFHTHRGHVLKDLIKFENDVLYIFTDINNEAELIQAQYFSDLIMSVHDLAHPLPPLDARITHQPLIRAYQTIQHLRHYYPALIHTDRDPQQWLIAHLRYAVHTLSFDESNAWQKQWALYSACLAADLLAKSSARIGPLRVDWIPNEHTLKGKLGLTIAPGRRDMNRQLDKDLTVLKANDTRGVVCFITKDEMAHYGISDLLDRYRATGIDVQHLPILDGRVPSQKELEKIMAWLHQQLDSGNTIVMHCAGGLGRAGTIAACFLVTQGHSAEDAIKIVRQARSPRALETAVQIQLVHTFAEQRSLAHN